MSEQSSEKVEELTGSEYKINMSGQSLRLIGNTTSEILLELTDADGNVSPFAFGLQYYRPSNGTTSEGNSTLPSGAYIFKPKMDDQESHPYSALSSFKILRDGHIA